MSAAASAQKRKKTRSNVDADEPVVATDEATTADDAKTAAPPVDAAAAKAPSADVVATPTAVLSEDQTRNAWAIGLSLGALGTVASGLLFGPALAVLVLAGCAAASVIALFWQSLRTLIGEAPLTSADTLAAYSIGAEEEQKRAVLRALKDLEFERNVGKISEEDYTRLLLRYRAEAKSLLKQIDEKGAAERKKAEQLVEDRFLRQGLGPSRALVPTAEELAIAAGTADAASSEGSPDAGAARVAQPDDTEASTDPAATSAPDEDAEPAPAEKKTS